MYAAIGHPIMAAEAMERLARRTPSDASLWSDASALRFEQASQTSDMRITLQALALADHALAVDPDRCEAYFNRGLAYRNSGRLLAALDDFHRAVDIDPVDANARYQRGLTFATTAAGGVCVRFHEPVEGLLPRGPLRHPAVTVTVEDPDDLVRFIEQTT